jgi:signal transduction histidine kinase
MNKTLIVENDVPLLTLHPRPIHERAAFATLRIDKVDQNSFPIELVFRDGIASATGRQAGLAVQFNRLAEVARESAVLEERNRLAAEIHDSITQLFAGIVMGLGVAEEEMVAGEGAPLSQVRQAKETAEFGLEEVRRFAFGLRSSFIGELGLVAALQKLVERSKVAGRLRCDFHAKSIPEEGLPTRVQHELFRMAQEAIGNAIRHAQPSVVTVNLRWTPPNLILEIQDNGDGVPKTCLEKNEGIGLRSMRERAAQINAKLDIQTAPGRGTRIIVTVPISLCRPRAI